VVEGSQDKVVSKRKAAQNMGVGDRWVRKLLQRMESEGDGVVVHRLRGGPPIGRLRRPCKPRRSDPKAGGLA
jgi:hypothetical protein